MADENICFRRVVAFSPRCAHRFEEIAPGLTPTFNMEWHAALRLRILKFYTLEKEFGPHTFFQRPFRLGKLQARDDANQTHEEEKCLGTLNADGTLTPPSDSMKESCAKNEGLSHLAIDVEDNTELYRSPTNRPAPCESDWVRVANVRRFRANGNGCPDGAEVCGTAKKSCCCPTQTYWHAGAYACTTVSRPVSEEFD